jgi:hypothetical protein
MQSGEDLVSKIYASHLTVKHYLVLGVRSDGIKVALECGR